MPYEIVRNDITKMEVDAIVNTANPRPVIGAGTDRAIHKAAGPELLEARKKIGNIAIGQSVATPAYNLHARYVLHTVSPAWKDGKHNEEELLSKAYDSALALALKLKCKSVAFPLMAAGSYGFPRDKALLIAVRVISEFTLHHRMKIYLVLFNEKAFSLAGGMFSGLKSFVDNNYVEDRKREEYSRRWGRGRRELEEMYEYQANYRRDDFEKAKYCLDDYGEEAVSDADVGGIVENANASVSRPVQETAKFYHGMSLEEVMQQDVSDFREHLMQLLQIRNESGEKDSDIYHRASISRQLFNKIINKKGYMPSKPTILQLAIGLKLDINETKTLLEKAGYALSRSSKSDMIIRYFIENKTYNIQLINIALYDYNQPLLSIS